jgi:hypothetical protein
MSKDKAVALAMADMDLQVIKQHGYRVDTRGPRFTLIKGVRATSHETLVDAIDHALLEIAEKEVN